MRRLRVVGAAFAAVSLIVGCQSDVNPAGDLPSTKVSDAPTKVIGDDGLVGDEAMQQAPNSVEHAASRDVAGDAGKKGDGGPQVHTVFFRANAGPAKMPKVQFSKRELSLCKVMVGDEMPAIELPKVDGGGTAKLAALFGKKATVVVFWKGDRRMAVEQLADVAADIVEPFEKEGVAVIGIAVNESAESAGKILKIAAAKFVNLFDTDGKAFAEVGSERLPRTYVLDSNGKIVWFDIEYSLTTRRELHDALRSLTEK